MQHRDVADIVERVAVSAVFTLFGVPFTFGGCLVAVGMFDRGSILMLPVLAGVPRRMVWEEVMCHEEAQSEESPCVPH
jgi:hypothetical protein